MESTTWLENLNYMGLLTQNMMETVETKNELLVLL